MIRRRAATVYFSDSLREMQAFAAANKLAERNVHMGMRDDGHCYHYVVIAFGAAEEVRPPEQPGPRATENAENKPSAESAPSAAKSSSPCPPCLSGESND